MNPEDVDLESHLGVEPGRLDEDVRARLAEFVASREGQLADLPERVAQWGFTVSHLSVDRRANVVNTDDDLRDTLPDPASRPAPESLSELRFSVRSDQGVVAPDLATVPDTVGMTEAGAGERYSLDEITAVGSGEPAGTVIEQEPEPDRFAAGEGLTLTISPSPEPADDREDADDQGYEGTDDDSESSAESGSEAGEAVDRLEAAAAAPVDADALADRDLGEIDGIGDPSGQRLRNAGVESLADLALAEPTRVADAATVPDDRAAAWIEAALTVARSRAGDEYGSQDA